MTANTKHGRYSKVLQSTDTLVAWIEQVAAECAADPLASVDLSGEIVLLRGLIGRRLSDPTAQTDEGLAVILACLDRLTRMVAVDAQRIEREMEREARTEARAAAGQVEGEWRQLPEAPPPISEADRLRQWARELQSEAEHCDLWPDGSCGEVCRRLVELADSFDHGRHSEDSDHSP